MNTNAKQITPTQSCTRGVCYASAQGQPEQCGAQSPWPGEADEFDNPAMKLTTLRKKLATAEDAAKSAGEACDDYERMYQESRATLIRAAIAALVQQRVPDAVWELPEKWRVEAKANLPDPIRSAEQIAWHDARVTLAHELERALATISQQQEARSNGD